MNDPPLDYYHQGFENSGFRYTDLLPEFAQTQLPATSDEAPPLFSYDDSLRFPAPNHWSNTTTATSTSSVSTPLPVTDQSSSDNDLSRQPSLESKRKSPELDPSIPTKRLKSGKRGPHTAQNRASGACLHCQMRKNKHACVPGVDPNGPCKACLKQAYPLSPAVCRRARFQDVEIVRLGPTRDFANTLRWLQNSPKDPQKAEWKRITNMPIRKTSQARPIYITLRLSQGHSDDTLNLRVQEFDPVAGDKVNYTWIADGVEQTYSCPRYAIADKYHATEEVRRFLYSNVEKYVDRLLPADGDLRAVFVRKVFQQALDRAHDSPLDHSAIRFWVAGRFIEDPWSIKGEETLGMTFDTRPTSPCYQRIPVTPIMDFQIDNIVIYDHLKTILGGIRTEIRKRIMPIEKEDWFDIHLATFILLHHVDLTMKHDIDFAIQHNLSKRFSNKALIEMISVGANTLLEYHQHEQGHLPLSAPNWHEIETNNVFDENQRKYLVEARALIQQINTPRKPGDALFWTSQMHDSKWQPAVVEVI